MECHACGYSTDDGSLAVHGHGCFARRLITVFRGRLVRIKLWKQRWRCRECLKTWHSRPPDEVPRIKACTLTVLIILYAALWFAGLYWFLGVPADASLCVDDRTVARWRQRALMKAAQTEEAIRKAVEKRNELVPEILKVGSGLSPPDHLLRRPWSSLPQATGLWRGIRWLKLSHKTLGVSCAEILAQARQLNNDPTEPFLI